MNHLHVVTSLFNPRRFRSRARLYRDFETYVKQSGAVLHTVEMAFGDRSFEVTQAATADQLQFRTHSELWHKERLLNLLIAQVAQQQPDAKYFAWIDADVTFANPNWVQETIDYLQHYHVLQLFETCHNLGPDNKVLTSQHGIVAGWAANGKIAWENPARRHYGFYYHPGFAWAATRWALDQLGGLFDVCVAGSGDTHMAGALCGDWRFGFPDVLQATPYGRALEAWGRRADASIERNVGHLPGSLFHHWHGRAQDRGYDLRWQTLIDHKFDPVFDIQNDINGCLAWSGANPGLQAAIRRSLATRNEDSTDS
jgi:hypothetical protein